MSSSIKQSCNCSMGGTRKKASVRPKKKRKAEEVKHSPTEKPASPEKQGSQGRSLLSQWFSLFRLRRIHE